MWPLTVTCSEAPNPSCKFGQLMTWRLWELFISAEKRSCKGSLVGSVCKLHRAATLGLPFWAAHPCVISVGWLISSRPANLEVIAVLSRWISMFLCHSPTPITFGGYFLLLYLLSFWLKHFSTKLRKNF